MKNFSKKLVTSIVTILITLSSGMTAALPVRAANSETIPAAPLFCSSLNTIGSQIELKLNNVSKQSLPNIYDPTRLSNRHSAIKKELAEKRAQWDNQRDEQYNKMLSLAQNDAQKAAIESFKTSVETAILVRRNSVDNAISVYFSQTSDELSSESTQPTKDRQDFITAVKNAITTAQSDCQTNKPASEIRSTFQTNLSAARTRLQTSRQNIGEIKTQLENIRKQEVQSINEAVTVFQESMTKARQTLIDELKKSGANTDQFAI